MEVKPDDQADDFAGRYNPGCRGTRGLSAERRRPIELIITTTADHPSWGDAWVVRRTARCGNVVGADAAAGSR
jgi:hypothetical protein